MELRSGVCYRFPDGRRLKARLDFPHFSSVPVWSFEPPDSVESLDRLPTRDRVSQMLMLQGEKIFRYDFVHGPTIRETRWTVADLVEEKAADGST
jgi:hypothetical protein